MIGWVLPGATTGGGCPRCPVRRLWRAITPSAPEAAGHISTVVLTLPGMGPGACGPTECPAAGLGRGWLACRGVLAPCESATAPSAAASTATTATPMAA